MDIYAADVEAAATARILGLLQGISEPKDDPRTAAVTPLEYRGQWQPKPNGAETGHGVVPKDWAIEVASENDRTLATFGWAGGAQLCLSNAFRQVKEFEAQAQDLIDSGICTEEDAAVQCIRTIATATEEREAVMRRQWCDIDFQQGEEANQEIVKLLERDFASQLASTAMRQVGPKVPKEGAPPCEQWYNIKVSGGTKAGKIYLSAQAGGDGAHLTGYDDESGRQRWLFEPGADGDSGSFEEDGNLMMQGSSWCRIRLAGGTTLGRRLLSRGARGRLELCELDDGSGRQRWRVEHADGCPGCLASIHPAVGAGDPGTGAAASVEAEALGRRLGGDIDGNVSLHEADDGSGCQRWTVTGSGGSLPGLCGSGQEE
ncbi:unnamed protein product, partial [Polarella glacialis]